jgi:quercetin dioxygenase-like cupin family protein
MSVELAELPPPPAFLRLVRIVLQPGAGVPMHSHPGPEAGVVEHGVITVETAGAVAVASATGERTEVPESGATFELASGDQIVYPAGVPFGFRNEGDRPAAILTVVVLPAGAGRPPGSEWVNGAPGADAMEGVSSIILGDAAAPGWPAAPLIMQIDALELDPGDPIPGWPGPVMIAAEKGQFGFTLLGGEYQLSGNGAEPEAKTGEGKEQLISPGDAVFFPGGMNDLPRDETQGRATIIRFGISSRDAGPSAPAATPPPARENAATPIASGFEEGGQAVIAEDGVRLRDEPSTGGKVLAELPAGSLVVIVGAAIEADGFAWFPVELADDPAVSGYIADPGLAANP